ncbi:MAG TPA: DUF3800 domain-containing protein [Candidatus Dojkabacteria bacterium]|jgi:hypothetical protein|nr:DUF3800 domain-containing protein [Candidatus Dojkabacteria bacterium]
MIVFIDESGDPGIKLDKGSSPFFVLCMILFNSKSVVEKSRREVVRFKKSLGKSDCFEFKFRKANKELRLKFLSLVKDFDMRVVCLVVDKNSYFSHVVIKNKHDYYNYFFRQLLTKNLHLLDSAKLVVDGKKEREMKRAINSEIRGLNGKYKDKYISGVKYVDSRSEPMIQVVDMVVGSIYKSLERGRNDSDIYLEVIRKKVIDVCVMK